MAGGPGGWLLDMDYQMGAPDLHEPDPGEDF
jgi:hypothetical protein